MRRILRILLPMLVVALVMLIILILLLNSIRAEQVQPEYPDRSQQRCERLKQRHEGFFVRYAYGTEVNGRGGHDRVQADGDQYLRGARRKHPYRRDHRF